MEFRKKRGMNIFIKQISKNCTKGQKKLQGLKGYSNDYESHNFVNEIDE